jgi:hypothetical protein
MDRHRSGLLAGSAAIASCQRQPRRAISSSYMALALPWALNASKCAYRRIGLASRQPIHGSTCEQIVRFGAT